MPHTKTETLWIQQKQLVLFSDMIHFYFPTGKTAFNYEIDTEV